jgi:hypothetical protein
MDLVVMLAQQKPQVQDKKIMEKEVQRRLSERDSKGNVSEAERPSTTTWQDLSQKSVEELVGDLSGQPRDLGVIGALWERGDESALPVLSETFRKLDDKYEKQIVALALLKVDPKGTNKETRQAWKFLVAPAMLAVEDKTPFPFRFVEGRVVSSDFDEEFQGWCAKQGCEPTREIQKTLITEPVDVLMLALADDTRAIPILRQGLESKNYLIATRSAQGLAILQDGSAIEKIIDVCRKAPPEAAATIAQSLVFFPNDPRANAATEEFISNKELLNALREQAKAKGPKKGVLGLQ